MTCNWCGITKRWWRFWSRHCRQCSVDLEGNDRPRFTRGQYEGWHE